MKLLLISLAVLAGTLLTPVANAATPPPMPSAPMPVLAMGQRHAVNVKEVMDDRKHPVRAQATREQVKATCDAAKNTSDFVVSVQFTANADRERTLKAPGVGATPNLTKKETGGSAARLFPISLSKKDKLGGFQKDQITKSERDLLRIYTEEMDNPARQQFAMSYLQMICSAKF